MVELLNALGVEYVVLGNHEFDFGADTLLKLLDAADFTVLGSNVRYGQSGEIFPGVSDVVTIEMENGAVVGMFGITTANSALDSNAGPNVTFESEVEHTQRCVDLLKARGADIVVALTHVPVHMDRLIARRVAGIDLILGGHDHEPMTLVEKATMIHKSGQDVLWLGRIDAHVSNPFQGPVQVSLSWKMYMNRGHVPDPDVQKIHQQYLTSVEAAMALEGDSAANYEPLATLEAVLDGTKPSLRCGESNLGNLVADALLAVYPGTDLAIMNAGAIKTERLFVPPMVLTRDWAGKVVSDQNHIAVLKMKAKHVENALLALLKRYPSPNSSHPQIAGLFLTLHDAENRVVAVEFFRDCDRTQKILEDETLAIAVTDFMRDKSEGRHFFSPSSGNSELVFESEGYTQDVVAAFVAKQGKIAYPMSENRQRVNWVE